MSIVFAALFPVFVIIALGFALKQFDIIASELWRGIELLAYWVLLPSLLIVTMVKADLASIDVSVVSATMVAAFLTMSGLLITFRVPLSALLAMSPAGFTSIYQSSVRWNAFVALPIAVELYGDTGAAIVAIIMVWLVPIANAAAVAVLARYAGGETKPSIAATLYIIFRNPFIWATFLGLAINLAGITIYQPLFATLSLVGGGAIAVSLLMVGAGLMLRDAFPPTRAAIAGCVLKLFGMPLVVFAWAAVFGVTGDTLVVAIICAAVPTAVNGYVLARQMGGDAPLQSAILTLQTIASFVTIPALIWMVQ